MGREETASPNAQHPWQTCGWRGWGSLAGEGAVEEASLSSELSPFPPHPLLGSAAPALALGEWTPGREGVLWDHLAWVLGREAGHPRGAGGRGSLLERLLFSSPPCPLTAAPCTPVGGLWHPSPLTIPFVDPPISFGGLEKFLFFPHLH